MNNKTTRTIRNASIYFIMTMVLLVVVAMTSNKAQAQAPQTFSTNQATKLVVSVGSEYNVIVKKCKGTRIIVQSIVSLDHKHSTNIVKFYAAKGRYDLQSRLDQTTNTMTLKKINPFHIYNKDRKIITEKVTLTILVPESIQLIEVNS